MPWNPCPSSRGIDARHHVEHARYLFVAIDRATRWVFIRICNSKTAANAQRFLRDLERACPLRIRTVLTERAIDGAIGPSPMASGKDFTGRLFGLRKRSPTGKNEFDRLCTNHSPLSLGPMARHGSSSNTALPRRSIRKGRRIRQRSGGPFPRRTAWSNASTNGSRRLGFKFQVQRLI